jgi:hypothetical protein
MIDVDSTICEVHGYHKQGTCYGYTHRLGYHPLLATRADTGEMLHARLRKGAANTARGIARFVDELVARLRRAGAVGELTFRMDSGFWSAKLIRRLRAHKVHYSITVRQTKTVRAAITAIPDAAWVSILYAPDGVAEVAETPYQVWWRLDDGTQGSKTFDSRGLARDFKNELLAQATAYAWVDPRRGRIQFDDWADHWWQLWSSSPRRSPQRQGDHRKPPALSPSPLLRPPPAPPDHPLDRAALATRAGATTEP